VNDAIWEKNLLARVLGSGKLAKDALRFAGRCSRLVDAPELEDLGRNALVIAVRVCPRDHAKPDAFCLLVARRAMLTGIRIEAREKRVDRSAWRAAAELLAYYEAEAGAPPLDELEDLAHAVAAGTFVAMTEEAMRGGDDDMIAREEYATAMSVLRAVLDAAPTTHRRLFVLHYQEGQTFDEARRAIGVHINTVMRWHDNLLAEIKKQLEKLDIHHAPGRGGAPRVSILTQLNTGADDTHR
jgi:DNA-directed RNA polymerase specialized sigma24 family protein